MIDGPHEDLYQELCSYTNLDLAFRKARMRKTLKQYVIDFEDELDKNLQTLQTELLFHYYSPQPLKTFILKDPKTRKISKSVFRDRVVHHAICNVIEPLFEKKFIYDSYANRIGKGTLKAVQRFDKFKIKVSRNNTRICYIFKADIKQYFERVDHSILLSLLQKEITDKKIIWLIKKILVNHKTKEEEKGMPLGNLTSQFFANVYLHELDIFVKHKLRAKHYIRYVDDFVILHHDRKVLEENRKKIEHFLENELSLVLHPRKSGIFKLKKGISLLGLRVFPHHKLLQKKNLRKFERKFQRLEQLYKEDIVPREKIVEIFEGWLAFAIQENTTMETTKKRRTRRNR